MSNADISSGKRYGVVAPELSEKSYCFRKGFYFWGVKLRAIAFPQKGKLPSLEFWASLPLPKTIWSLLKYVAQLIRQSCLRK